MILNYFRMWTCAFCLFPMSPLPDTEESPDMLMLNKYKNLETEIHAFLITKAKGHYFYFLLANVFFFASLTRRLFVFSVFSPCCFF